MIKFVNNEIKLGHKLVKREKKDSNQVQWLE